MSVEKIVYGNISQAVQEGNEAAILALVTRVTAQAKVLAPVEYGQLKNSIMGRVHKKDIDFNKGGKKAAPNTITPKAKEGQGYVGSNLLHAIYNEFGTRKMAAQPYLRPAISAEANGSSVKATVKKLQVESVKNGMREGPRKRLVF